MRKNPVDLFVYKPFTAFLFSDSLRGNFLGPMIQFGNEFVAELLSANAAADFINVVQQFGCRRLRAVGCFRSAHPTTTFCPSVGRD